MDRDPPKVISLHFPKTKPPEPEDFEVSATNGPGFFPRLQQRRLHWYASQNSEPAAETKQLPSRCWFVEAVP